MQTTVLLVESTLEQAVVNALDYLVLELAHVRDLEHLHHVTVGDDGLLGGHIGDGNQLKLAELDRFKGKVATGVLAVGRNGVVCEKIQGLQMLRLGSQLQKNGWC